MVGEGSASDAGKGAAIGAGAGSFFGPIGTGIGAAGGALLGWLFGSGGNGDSKPMVPAGYGWMSPTLGQEGKSDIWGPPEMYMQHGQSMREPVRGPVKHARKLSGEAIGEQRRGLGMLRRRAMGQDSVARQAGKREREATQRQIMATARSGRRGPAASRTALMQTSRAGQMISGKIAEAESKERLAAEKAYYAAASGMRGDALKQQQTEQQWWRMKADWERVKKEVLAKYMALGLQEKEAERRARIDYQKLLAQIYNKHLQHKNEMSQRENKAWMGLISSGIKAIGAYAGAKGSDVRGKANVQKLEASYTDYPMFSSLYMSEPVGSNVVSDVYAKQNLSPLTAPLSTTPTAGTQMATQAVSPIAAPVTGKPPAPVQMQMAQPAAAAPSAPRAQVATPLGTTAQATFAPPPSAAPVQTSQQETENMLDSLTAYSFDYKPGFGPPGRQVGVMAQDLEQSPMGAQMVSDTGPAGTKMVDYSPETFNPVAMASLANLNERVRGLEGDVGAYPDVRGQEEGSLRNALLAGGAELQRPSPVAPQQGVLTPGGGMAATEEKPDIRAVQSMLAQMGGRV